MAIIPVVFKIANDFFFADTDSEDENDMGDDKIYGFVESVIPRMSDRQFQMHFRLQPESFEVTLKMLHSVICRDQQVTPGQPRISLEKELLLTLWSLANLESFRL
jgi:hypothetical protein